MSLMLKKLGFQVISVIDGTKKDIDTAIQNMRANKQGRQAVAIIYYAGHGLQHNWDYGSLVGGQLILSNN